MTSWRCVIGRVLVAVLSLVVVTTAGGGVTAAAAPDTSGAACTGVDAQQSIVVGDVPMLFVHGIISNPDMWGPDKPVTTEGSVKTQASKSVFEQVDALQGVAAYRFDYSDKALTWVRDDKIGPALARTIHCLRNLHGRRVVVVAHSMGGLATQYALGQSIDGQKVADDVERVVALGTPFQGSLALSVSQAAIAGTDIVAAANGDVGLAAGMEAVLSLCARWGQDELARDHDNPCGLASVPRSPVGTALMYRSDEIKALPPWPSQVPLQTHAGDAMWDIAIPEAVWPLKWKPIGRVSVGDGPVSYDSATAIGKVGEHLKCLNTGLYDLLFKSECGHTRLQTQPQVVAAIVKAVSESVTNQASAPAKAVDWRNRTYQLSCDDIVSKPVDVTVRNGSATLRLSHQGGVPGPGAGV